MLALISVLRCLAEVSSRQTTSPWAAAVALISGDIWKSRYGSDPLLHLFHPGENRSRHGLVGSVDREYFRHVALSIQIQHHRAMIFPFFTKLILQGDIGREHGAIHSRIEFGSSEYDGHLG